MPAVVYGPSPLDLVAGKDIKFLAGDAWGAFDYEDNSGGSTATGTPVRSNGKVGTISKHPLCPEVIPLP